MRLADFARATARRMLGIEADVARLRQDALGQAERGADLFARMLGIEADVARLRQDAAREGFRAETQESGAAKKLRAALDRAEARVKELEAARAADEKVLATLRLELATLRAPAEPPPAPKPAAPTPAPKSPPLPVDRDREASRPVDRAAERRREWRLAAALACPECGAEGGQACFDYDDDENKTTRKAPHGERFAAARATIAAARAAVARPCPTCDAPAGKPCGRDVGELGLHPARVAGVTKAPRGAEGTAE